MDNHHFDSGVTLNVKDFSHWVYVYDWSTTQYSETDPIYGDQVYGIPDQYYVEVGYVGDNIYSGLHSDWWPSEDSNGNDTKLPWLESNLDNNAYEAWTWIEEDYPEQGQKAWRHNEYLTEEAWDFVYETVD